MPDTVTRFLGQLDALLTRLDGQLDLATSQREAAWTLCEFTGRELNLADCVVYLPDGNDGLMQTAAWGPKRVAENMLESRIRLNFGKGIVGDCARQLRTQRADDTRRDPRYVRDQELNLSELAVPIHHQEILLGVLDSEHPETGFYDARYEQVFEAIAERGAARLWRLRG
ncbi:MAG TPA: GAF domain-containing protein [Lysobacter sp.]|jgi:putative methionine-R-sulfoxide reductase with GAF domain|nr:GAF domain-containing protein [Lysobacter sp.]